MIFSVLAVLACLPVANGQALASQAATPWQAGIAADVAPQPERFWIGQVTWPAANVHAKPNAQSDIRRVANEGDLLRVAGRSSGIDGDAGEWWATTEGYVALDGLREASGEWVEAWQMPNAEEALHGFWVEVGSQASVRAGPTLNAPTVGTLEPGMRVKVLAEERDPDGDPVPWYRIDGGRYAGARLYSGRASRLPDPQPNATPPSDGASGRWLVVDRQASSLTLVQDGQPLFVTYVSLGRAGVDTPSGLYHIVSKVAFEEMNSARNPTADRS